MAKRKWLIPICVILGLLLVCMIAIVCMAANSLSFSVGRCLIANGHYMLVLDNFPIQMSNRTGNEDLFAKLSDGDKILVLHDGIAESYPGKTGAYAVCKLSDGTVGDIPYEVRAQLNHLGWKTEANLNLPEAMPEDFSFALTWGCYGISSYDSRTGKLVKTKDATHPEDYITEYALPEESRERIYDCIRALDINSYPPEYNPHGDDIVSCPPMTLILTVRAGGAERTIQAENIAISYESKNEKGQSFLTACKAVCDILTATEEWKALPDYEFFYD